MPDAGRHRASPVSLAADRKRPSCNGKRRGTPMTNRLPHGCGADANQRLGNQRRLLIMTCSSEPLLVVPSCDPRTIPSICHGESHERDRRDRPGPRRPGNQHLAEGCREAAPAWHAGFGKSSLRMRGTPEATRGQHNRNWGTPRLEDIVKAATSISVPSKTTAHRALRQKGIIKEALGLTDVKTLRTRARKELRTAP